MGISDAYYNFPLQRLCSLVPDLCSAKQALGCDGAGRMQHALQDIQHSQQDMKDSQQHPEEEELSRLTPAESSQGAGSPRPPGILDHILARTPQLSEADRCPTLCGPITDP